MSLPFRVMVISDRSVMGADPIATALELARSGVPGWSLQWREKHRTPGEVYQDLRELETGLREYPGAPLLLVNDRLDIARALELHVHLAESSLPTRVARSLLPGNQLVGRSVHSVDRARSAAEEGADYLLFGPIYETPSKHSFGPPQGVEALRVVAASVDIPVLAVGGIDRDRAVECRQAGAFGVAVIRIIWESASSVTMLRSLVQSTGPGD